MKLGKPEIIISLPMRSYLQAHLNEVWLKLTIWNHSRRAHWIITMGLLLITLIGLGIMLYHSRSLLLTYEWHISPSPLIVSFLTYSLALALAVLAWGLMLNRLAGQSSWAGHIRIYCLTNLTKRLPGILWHVLGRTVMYEREGVGKLVVSISSGLEFVLLILSGLMVSLLTWPLLASSKLGNPWWFLVSLIAGLIVIHPTIIRFILGRLGTDAIIIRDLSYRDIISWLMIYVVIWGLGGVILYSIIATIYPIPLALLPGLIGAWSLSGVIATLGTFSPSGLGLREITLSLLLALFIPPGVAVVVAILVRILLTLYEAAWALLASRVWS